MPSSEEHEILQRKIFSRWLASKLQSANIPVKSNFDCVNDITGWYLLKLVETLSESTCKKASKCRQNAKIRAQQIDAAGIALDFLREQGVEMKLPPSAENLVSHEIKPILGLVWALMRKYIRFSDDDDGPNPQESLLMWVNMQTNSYRNRIKEAKKFPSDFHDGMILCAIIHKHRPKLMDLDSLNPSNKEENLTKAFVAAEKFFDLEQFLKPSDFLKLDDKSMFVYVSEYFYGIARMRKFQLNAKRISKLIDFTRVNDSMKIEFSEKAKTLREYFDKVMSVLNDRAIDNTMEGARHKLKEFFDYNANDKPKILGKYLDVESFYNRLALRLSDHNRPPFKPSFDVSLEGLNKSLKQLEETEKERSVALHKELNRQIKLVRENEKHASLHSKFNDWAKEKEKYLKDRSENITSTNSASYHINKLNAYEEECKTVEKEFKKEMNAIFEFLSKEKYENLEMVKLREKEMDKMLLSLSESNVLKREVLNDHLARENFNESLELDNIQHIDLCAKVSEFFNIKSKYLNQKEQVSNVDEARAALSTLESCVLDIDSYKSTNAPGIKEFGIKIKNSIYKTKFSSSKFEKSDDLDSREAKMDKQFEDLYNLIQEKQKILDDDMEREIFKEDVRLLNDRHIKASEVLKFWANEKKQYLQVKESINSISSAQLHLSRLQTFKNEQIEQENNQFARLKSLGNQIITSKFDKLSKWTFESPEEIEKRQNEIQNQFQQLSELYNQKHEVLKDDLTREKYKARVLLLNERHIQSFKSISVYCDDFEKYLNTKEKIDSISEANLQLAKLVGRRSDKEKVYNNTVGAFKKLGNEVRISKYDEMSFYSFEDPNSVSQLEKQIDERFNELETLSEKKENDLNIALKLEEKKEANRVLYANEATEIRRWISASCKNASDTHFGFSFTEVEEYVHILDKEDDELIEIGKKKQLKAQEIFDSGVSLGVKNNVYTNENSQTISDLLKELDNALKTRRESYEIVLKKEKENDDLCKRFADLINGFSDKLTELRAKIASSSDPLENQLQNVIKMRNERSEEKKIIDIESLQKQIEEKQITNNRHTFLNSADAHVIYEQFDTFLDRKAKMIQEEIEQKKLRGLTLDQFKEIEEQFAYFDADNSSKLNRAELKACLFSLGEEVSKKQVEKILHDFGDEKNGLLDQEGFKAFMIGILGVSDSREEIKNAFLMLNRGDNFGSDENMEQLFSDEDLAFIKKTAPIAQGNKWDYNVWIEEVYSR